MFFTYLSKVSIAFIALLSNKLFDIFNSFKVTLYPIPIATIQNNFVVNSVYLSDSLVKPIF
jgi:hypothetical protein